MKYDGYTSSQTAAYLNEPMPDSITTLQFFNNMLLGPPNDWWSNETIFYDSHLLAKIFVFDFKCTWIRCYRLAFLRKQGAAFSELVYYEHSDINTA